MAAAQKDRSAKTAAKRKRRGEEELRLHCLPGTRQALAELMTWSGIEEQGEAITLMIHHLHGLGRAKSAQFLAVPRHEYEVPRNVARLFQQKSLSIIHQNPGDEVIAP